MWRFVSWELCYRPTTWSMHLSFFLFFSFFFNFFLFIFLLFTSPLLFMQRYRGVYLGQDVAVKILRSEHLNESLEDEFEQEVAILRWIVLWMLVWSICCNTAWVLLFCWPLLRRKSCENFITMQIFFSWVIYLFLSGVSSFRKYPFLFTQALSFWFGKREKGKELNIQNFASQILEVDPGLVFYSNDSNLEHEKSTNFVHGFQIILCSPPCHSSKFCFKFSWHSLVLSLHLGWRSWYCILLIILIWIQNILYLTFFLF